VRRPIRRTDKLFAVIGRGRYTGGDITAFISLQLPDNAMIRTIEETLAGPGPMPSLFSLTTDLGRLSHGVALRGGAEGIYSQRCMARSVLRQVIDVAIERFRWTDCAS